MKTQETVRDFYERLPYPPAVGDVGTHRDAYRDPIRRRALFHRMWPERMFELGQKILIAGCGTAQGARYALRYPDAHVTAIDISETSLRYTRHLQRTHSLANLEIHRLAIEDVKELGSSFDMIVCTGVLHHLPDPDIGLSALRDVLEPGGALHLMVYARYGRAGIYMMQEYCRLLGIGTSPEDLQTLHAALDMLRLIMRSRGCYTTRRIFGNRRRWQTRSSIPSIAPTPFPNCMTGSSAAGSRSRAG